MTHEDVRHTLLILCDRLRLKLGEPVLSDAEKKIVYALRERITWDDHLVSELTGKIVAGD